MSEIKSVWLEKYFEDRPQLTPPPTNLFGYTIDSRWCNAVLHLLEIVENQNLENEDSGFKWNEGRF